MKHKINDELSRFLTQLSEIQVHRTRELGSSLKKPLLLLLLIAKIEHANAARNRFRFADIRDELAALILQHGGRAVNSGPKPELPFIHLRTSPFWKLITPNSRARGEKVRISDLLADGAFGAFDSNTFNLLSSSPEARLDAFQHILDQWWPESLHDDLREALTMPRMQFQRRRRAPEFVVDVLKNYRYSCAVCGFHGILNGHAIGIDACHIKWHSASGPDSMENGIALCKLHHWAFDKGIISIDFGLQIHIAATFVVHASGGLPIESLEGKRICVDPRHARPSATYLKWHQHNVFLS